MSLDQERADFSEDEEEELMFKFEEQDAELSPRLHSGDSQIFYSIDGVDFERPANPMVAILECHEAVDRKKRGREEDGVQEPDADVIEEEMVATPVLKGNPKRTTFELPNAPARVIRPLAKRFKLNGLERSITAPACLMDNLSLYWTKDETIPELEDEEPEVPFRSASINIPNTFQPINWPGDAAISHSYGKDRSHSCSSSSSSKSWASGLGLFCRRSLDVSSPLRVRLNDLMLHPSAGSYSGL
ncbi:uncharacterized protein PHALS_04549 [Plasmopara halstedii]|uniref:Uncharacterized protein n=1 Tax=Plasmopara halstedii TaxID=4781 RepID=A0A0P1A9S7_PLAHL|nr:uncharacterized protein PHALS_04549 [Plasmopara halstedii]CEG37090.1 hypothetical protein PHALS_04549 [Plasmopara halstedii]|eukprot:XP_024573459.1 hypothetical protein PHALS_04549 [Plasmopara halstedii]